MPAFKTGDTVAWSHNVATLFPAETTVRLDAVKALDSEARTGQVKKVANTEGTHFDVKLDGGGTATLTCDEIVKVSE